MLSLVSRPLALGAFAASMVGAAGTPVLADERLRVSGYANGDVVAVVSGGATHRARWLDKQHIDVDSDLAALLGWGGASAHLSIENVSGAVPNDDLGTVQGIDNIEVGRHRTRLYEAWIEQSLGNGRASILAGLYDLNSEFYVTESAGLLLGPAFGIGTELAVTGSNGPAVYPSSALTVRFQAAPSETTFVRAAALNARAGTFGDPDGVDTGFDEGLLLIGEAGWNGPWTLSAGAWTYTRRQDDLADVDAAGVPLRRSGHGGYVMAEGPLMGTPDQPGFTTGFVRAGLSDGRTSPVSAGWQAGVLVGPVFAGRGGSSLAFGVSRAHLSDAFRAAEAVAGRTLDGIETQLELTYSDQITPWLSVQPDLQYIFNPGGDRGAKDGVVVGLRLTAAFGQ